MPSKNFIGSAIYVGITSRFQMKTLAQRLFLWYVLVDVASCLNFRGVVSFIWRSGRGSAPGVCEAGEIGFPCIYFRGDSGVAGASRDRATSFISSRTPRVGAAARPSRVRWLMKFSPYLCQSNPLYIDLNTYPLNELCTLKLAVIMFCL